MNENLPEFFNKLLMDAGLSWGLLWIGRVKNLFKVVLQGCGIQQSPPFAFPSFFDDNRHPNLGIQNETTAANPVHSIC